MEELRGGGATQGGRPEPEAGLEGAVLLGELPHGQGGRLNVIGAYALVEFGEEGGDGVGEFLGFGHDFFKAAQLRLKLRFGGLGELIGDESIHLGDGGLDLRGIILSSPAQGRDLPGRAVGEDGVLDSVDEAVVTLGELVQPLLEGVARAKLAVEALLFLLGLRGVVDGGPTDKSHGEQKGPAALPDQGVPHDGDLPTMVSAGTTGQKEDPPGAWMYVKGGFSPERGPVGGVKGRNPLTVRDLVGLRGILVFLRRSPAM